VLLVTFQKIETTEDFIEEKQFDWISRFSKELEGLLNYHPDFQYTHTELNDTDIFIDEVFLCVLLLVTSQGIPKIM
jgi:hypothetical protein